MDLVAAVEACRAEDQPAVDAIMRNGDYVSMLAASVKLWTEYLDEESTSAGQFRE